MKHVRSITFITYNIPNCIHICNYFASEKHFYNQNNNKQHAEERAHWVWLRAMTSKEEMKHYNTSEILVQIDYGLNQMHEISIGFILSFVKWRKACFLLQFFKKKAMTRRMIVCWAAYHKIQTNRKKSEWIASAFLTSLFLPCCNGSLASRASNNESRNT